ncbi:serine/threonine-protein kinase [Spirillospora sp. NBC_01491]|uniref:serine/threonine-protein kinase n=1 Tax=Spirillospora sp. NBC_01491 TaxID=2976007 RepID=UPI002E322541|nr:serine/threonine-protein kinase [Spirillospora sp. NBC_01491]
MRTATGGSASEWGIRQLFTTLGDRLSAEQSSGAAEPGSGPRPGSGSGSESAPRPGGLQPLGSDDPSVVGAYRLTGRLGLGGMGAVYLGSDEAGRQVAVKVIRRELALEKSFRDRFAEEVANARRVAPFCTARVLDHGEADGVPYMVTEYIRGPSLAEYIEEHGAMAAASVRAMAVGIATALTAIHTARLVHRDLKPRNVILGAQGPRIIDFGIARALDSGTHHTRTGAVIGSPGWIAPEQIFEERVGIAGDLFAWGCLVTFAATGRHPHGRGSMVVLATRARQGMHDLHGVPESLQALVAGALEPDPAARPTAEDLLLHLVGTQDPRSAADTVVNASWTPGPVPPPPAHPPSAALSRTRPPRRPAIGPPVRVGRRRRMAVRLAALGLVAAVGGSGVAFALRGDGGGGDGPAQKQPPSSAPSAAKLVRVEDACSLVPSTLITELMGAGASAVPTSKAPVQQDGDGAATGCNWGSVRQPGSATQQVRSLIVNVIVRLDAPERSGAVKAGTDFASFGDEAEKVEGKVSDGLRYGRIAWPSGVSDETFVITRVNAAAGSAAFGGSMLYGRTGNVSLQVKYGGEDHPSAESSRSGQARPLDQQVAREAAEEVGRAVVASLAQCAKCRE